MDHGQHERGGEGGSRFLAFDKHRMYFLYTSALNPKGKAARAFLEKESVQFTEIVVDSQGKEDFIKRAETLLQIFHESTSIPLSLPFLTQEKNGKEEIVLLGFVPNEWEELFQLRTGAQTEDSAGIQGFDPAHVPVVGAGKKPLE